jgi:hypothetical protein
MNYRSSGGAQRLENESAAVRRTGSAWRAFHTHMQALHAGLAAQHEAKVEALSPDGEGGWLVRCAAPR